MHLAIIPNESKTAWYGISGIRSAVLLGVVASQPIINDTLSTPPPKVFSWGNGRNGRLGLGDTRDRPSACHVEAIQGIEIEAVSCGVSHSMAVCSTGACYAWGKNNCGQCGNTDPVGSDAVRSVRHNVSLAESQFVVAVVGAPHTGALTTLDPNMYSLL